MESINLKDFIEKISYNKSQTYTKEEVLIELSKIQLLLIVDELPTQNIYSNKIYMVVNGENIPNNRYDLYVYINGDWEQIDSLEFNIDDYYSKSQMNSLLSRKSDVGHGHDNSRQDLDGFMSMEDKSKLDKSLSVGFGVLGGSTTAYTTSITGVTLAEGTLIAVYNNVGDNGNNATINVNGLGAKPLYYKASKITSGRLPNKSVVLLLYNTTILNTGCWQLIYSHDTTYTASNTTPKADTLDGSVGVASQYAREDHEHPFSDIYASKGHVHGEINNDGTMDTANRFVVTDNNKKITVKEKVGNITLNGELDTANRFVVTDNSKKVTVQEKVGNITLDGKLDTANRFVVTDTDKKITVKEKLGNVTLDGKITDSNGNAVASKNVCTSNDGSITTEAKNNHSHGSITSSGTLNSSASNVNNVVVTDNSNNIKTTKTLPYDNSTHHSLGTGLTETTDHTINHSNSITPVTSNSFKKISYDAEGHITNSTNVVKSDITGFNLNTGDIKDTTAYTNIGSTANSTQATINSKLDTIVGGIGTQIATAISNLELVQVVTALPTSNIKNNKIYMVKNDKDITGNVYDLYLYVNNKWEQIDSLEFNISDYYTKTETDGLMTSHTHGNISNDGKIGTSSGQVITTGTGGVLQANSTISGTKITSGTLTNTQIADNTITNAKLNDKTIDTGKIKDGAITTDKILDGTIKNEDIANTTITGSKLANGTVTATQLSGDSVTTVKIKDGNVTYAKLNSDVYESTPTNNSTKLITSGAVYNSLNSHLHGNIQNDGTLKVDNTLQTSKNVCTDGNGKIIAEAKNNHSHGSITSSGTLNSDISSVNKVAVTDSNNNLKTISKLPLGNVTHQDISGKINYTDVKNNLTSTDTDKPLSANQGKWLKDNTVQTAGTGLSKSSNTLNHSNSVIALTTSTLKKMTYDAQGHITASTNPNTTDLPNSEKYNNIKNGESTTLTLTNQKLVNDNINSTIGSINSQISGIINNNLSGVDLSNNHTHDDRYYTETELQNIFPQYHQVSNGNAVKFIKFLQIKVTGSWRDSTIRWTILKRSYPPCNISFNPSWNSTDSVYKIGNFYYDGTPIGVYVHLSATNTFDFYIDDTAKYGQYSISPISIDRNYMESYVTITKQNTLVDSLPTDTANLKQATINPYYKDTNTTYTNGNGINLSGTTFSANFEGTASNIKANGTANVGALNTIARADHIHPSDSNKVDKTNGVSQVTDNNASNYTNIGSLSNGASQQTINNTINSKMGNKVDKVSGMGLSTNDFNGTYKGYVDNLVSSTNTLKNAHVHGNITTDGKVTTTTTNVSRVVVTDGDVVKSIAKLPLNSVTHQDISGKENTSNKSSSITTDTGSTTKYPTVKAVEDYAQKKGNYLTSVATGNINANAVTLAKLNSDVYDTTPTDGSNKLITSDAVYDGLSGKANSSHNQATTTITNSETYANIGSNLTTQKLINDNINTQLGNKISKVSNSTDLLLANGTTKTQSSFATSGHNHSGTYVDGVGTKNGTNGSAIAEIKANSTVKGTVYHPKILNSAVSSGLYKITVNTDGHITATTSVGASDLPSNIPTSKITGLSAVATSNSYNDLDNLPTIPTNTNQLTNGAGFTTATGHNHDSAYLKLSGGNLTGAVSSNSSITTTGNITGAKFIKNSNSTNLLLANGNDLAQSTFATSGHNHSGTYVDGVGTKNTTNGSAIAEIKANTTVKGTIYHPKILSSNVSSGLYKITVNTDGHVTATTSVNIDDTVTSGSSSLIESGAVYDAINVPPTPSPWHEVTNITTNPPSRIYAQQMWYNYLTGMVELSVITPSRVIAPNQWLKMGMLVKNATDDMDGTLSSYVKDYVPFTSIYGIGQGLKDGYKYPLPIMLSSTGYYYAYNNTSSNFSGRIKFYLTYRCKLNRDAPNESET